MVDEDELENKELLKLRQDVNNIKLVFDTVCDTVISYNKDLPKERKKIFLLK